MKLSVFIHEHLLDILDEWESFARTMLPASEEMSVLELRDDAEQMLEAIVLDMESEQSAKEQRDKSEGLSDTDPAARSAATSHGALRQDKGFSIVQVTAEFRALRATVLRLWIETAGEKALASDELVRFNENIDQALAESVLAYSSAVTRTRDTFLAILGHDLRSPIHAVSLAGEYLSKKSDEAENIRQLGVRVQRSAITMSSMVNDLLEFARTQLGRQMPVARKWVDVGDICHWALDEASAVHSGCAFAFERSGDLRACIDGARLHQVFANLLTNAAQYQKLKGVVNFSAFGEDDTVVIQVQNFGQTIPQESLQTIFDPLVQLGANANQQGRPSSSMGLGLFIAREITIAHGGTIEAESTQKSGTIFIVRLPRHGADGKDGICPSESD